jgi:hypothetical protein
LRKELKYAKVVFYTTKDVFYTIVDNDCSDEGMERRSMDGNKKFQPRGWEGIPWMAVQNSNQPNLKSGL